MVGGGYCHIQENFSHIKEGQKTISGISRQRLSRILNGESKASIDELEDICSCFGLQLVALNSSEIAKIERFYEFFGDFGAKGRLDRVSGTKDSVPGASDSVS